MHDQANIQDYVFDIRYEGKDAESHRMELISLGESLQGFGRMYSSIAHFVVTEQFVKQNQSFSIKAYARETRAKCFSVTAVFDWVSQNGLLSGLGTAILGSIGTYVLHRCGNRKEEMRHLREVLEAQLKSREGANDRLVERLLETIDRLADSNRPSVKKAVAPIGKSCDQIDIHSPDSDTPYVLDQAYRDSALEKDDVELTPLKEFTILITELDRETGGCKIRLADEPDRDEQGKPTRISAKINDPVFHNDINIYLSAFAEGRYLTVQAKASLKEGNIKRLYISDAR